MSTVEITVGRRPAGETDESFCRALFVESRPELAALPPEAAATIIELQVRAQRQQYDAAYPNACHEILTVARADVGRLITAVGAHELRVVDVTVSAERRGEGIGAAVMGDVIRDAERRGLPVGLSVWSANEGARRLYERLGFVVTDDPGETGYLAMRRGSVEGSR